MSKSFEDLRRASVFRTKIMLANAWAEIPEPTDEDRRLADLHEGLFVEFKEPSIVEANTLRKVDTADKIDDAIKLMPVHLVDHNLTDSAGDKVGTAQVVDYIAASANLFNHVLYTWLMSLPLLRRNTGKSAT